MRPARGADLGVAALAAGCALLGSDRWDSPRAELDEARARWAESDVADYDLTIARLCFCPEDVRGPARVRVRNHTVVDRTYAGSGEPVDPQWVSYFPTVEGLFEFIEDAIDRDAHRLEVEYDPERGYPTRAWADYLENVADEELGFEATEFVPAP